jgi:hypothetical protein
MTVKCIVCGDLWHKSWAKKWDNNHAEFIHLPRNKFICLNCRCEK